MTTRFMAFVVLALLSLGGIYFFGVLKRTPEGLSLAMALNEARARNQEVMVLLTADWCPPCNKLKSEVLEDPELTATWARFVKVIVQADGLDSWSFEGLSTTNLPTMFILNSNGQELKRITGYNDRQSFLELFYSKDVIEGLRKKMESEPRNTEWRSELFTYYISRGEDDKARELMTPLEARSDNDAVQELQTLKFMEITGSFNRGKYNPVDVIRKCEAFLRDFPASSYSPSVVYYQARVLMNRDDSRSATKLMKALPQRFPRENGSFWRLIQFSYQEKVLDEEAEAAIVQGRQQFSDKFYLFMQSAQWFRAHGRNEEARVDLEKALTLAPGNTYLSNLKKEWFEISH